ncbi:MAG: dihydrofolate reductase [Candidatus Spechtbacterales bacterium]|nr:dihydrofolate reductase [Candidatus Spechtbacterales bacterium]
MKISLIAAAAENNVIGYKGDMPWGRAMKSDLRRFRELTHHKAVIIGRNTYEGLGNPLEGRYIIVLTRAPELVSKSDVYAVATSLEDALAKAERCIDEGIADSDEVMVAGGGNVYKQFLDKADSIYLTKIEHSFEGDTFFPDYSKDNWKVINSEHHNSDSENPYPYTFLTLQRT